MHHSPLLRQVPLAYGALLGTAILVLVTGCSADESTEPSGNESYVTQATHAREEAREGGASEAQLSAIDAAIEDKSVSMERLLEARGNLADCLEGSGASLQDRGVVDRGGFQYPDYVIFIPESADTDSAESLMNECEVKHFRWIDMLYQGQPSSVSGQEQEFVERMPQLVTCLTEADLNIPEGVSADELKQIMHEQMQESHPQPGDPGVTENEDGTLDIEFVDPAMDIVPTCLNEAGLSGF